MSAVPADENKEPATMQTIAAPSAAPKIVRILSVVDTRAYEEGPDDKWHPIPGSGQENQCARCGRLHEVHATVETSDGRVIVVGTGCMDAESADIRDRIKTATGRAKRIAKLRAEVAAEERQIAEWERINAIVDALPLPPIDEGARARKVGRDAGTQYAVYWMGDVSVWSLSSPPGTPINEERRRLLVRNWRASQAHARGGKYDLDIARHYLDEKRKRLVKLERAAV